MPDPIETKKTAAVSLGAPRVPWGYGEDRITAMPVDPERLFVYWEVTDAGIDAARERMGAAGGEATLVLRLYDVTGRIFDGTNAHAHVDHDIDRADRDRFLEIGKPCSEAIVEIGLKALDSEFVRIVRSTRADFPRRIPNEPRTPQWLTVRARDEPTPLALPRVDEGRASVEQEAPVVAPRAEFVAESVPAVRIVEIDRPRPPTERFPRGKESDRGTQNEHRVDGPWEVVIRDPGEGSQRRVLARWEIHRSWITDQGREVRAAGPAAWAPTPGSSGRIGLGASERRWSVGSERRLAGASERLYSGASERRSGGASERAFRGASERRLGGASGARISSAKKSVYPRIKHETG
jgi:hypothetical protein